MTGYLDYVSASFSIECYVYFLPDDFVGVLL